MSIVLRFLAGSLPEEIRMFLDLLFEPVKHFSNGTFKLLRCSVLSLEGVLCVLHDTLRILKCLDTWVKAVPLSILGFL